MNVHDKYLRQVEKFLVDGNASDEEIAEAIYYSMGNEQIVDLAHNLIRDDVCRVRRNRNTERQRERELKKDERWHQLFVDPARHYEAMGPRPRTWFRTWCGDRLDEWITRARRAIEATGDTGDTEKLKQFDRDWTSNIDEVVRGNIADEIRKMLDKLVARTTLEVTDELLQEKFERADGSMVAFGDADADEHEQFADQHAGSAGAGLETAARHLKAAELIRKSGARSLSETVESEGRA